MKRNVRVLKALGAIRAAAKAPRVDKMSKEAIDEIVAKARRRERR